MKIEHVGIRSLVSLVALTLMGLTAADPPTPITADEAFDAVQQQIDPISGEETRVILVDVRDPLEVFFNGAAAQVTEIHLKDNGTESVDEPVNGKVRLLQNGELIEYEMATTGGTELKLVELSKVTQLITEPIAINIPIWRRTEQEWKTNGKSFYPAVAKLARAYDVVILYCRTGGRSSIAGDGIAPGLFAAVYEIDDPGGQNGHGGFSGPGYSEKYNGYAGFPERVTPPDPASNDNGSVSWMDAGLPITQRVLPTPKLRP